MIELGSKVRCRYTGVTGIAVAECKFINGCVQYEVALKVKKDGSLPEPVGIDEQSLEVIAKPKKKKTVKKKVVKRRTGGANTKCMSMRGF